MKNEPKFKFWESSEKSFCAIFFNFVFSLVVMLGGQGGHLFRLLYPRYPFFMILLYFASIGRDKILFFCAYKFGNFFITLHRTSLLSSLISRVSPLFNVLIHCLLCYFLYHTDYITCFLKVLSLFFSVSWLTYLKILHLKKKCEISLKGKFFSIAKITCFLFNFAKFGRKKDLIFAKFNKI